jgi:IS5 family transposase
MAQNYLGGEAGVEINAFMSACAWNLKKMMEKLKKKFLRFISHCFFHKILSELLRKAGFIRND